MLSDYGLDINFRSDFVPGWPEALDSVLHIAVRRGFLDVVRLLLERGAMLDMQDHDGNTALDLARAVRKHDIVALMNEWTVCHGMSFRLTNDGMSDKEPFNT